MNKLIVLIAVICTLKAVTVAANLVELKDEAASSLSLYPSDEEETSKLASYQKVFSDFCIQSRDFIQANLKGSICGTFKTFKSLLNPVTMVETFKKVTQPGGLACQRIFKVQNQLIDRFEEYKSQLSKEVGAGPNTTFEWVDCLSTHRLIACSERCKLLIDFINLM